jgi:hypothetical protein
LKADDEGPTGERRGPVTPSIAVMMMMMVVVMMPVTSDHDHRPAPPMAVMMMVMMVLCELDAGVRGSGRTLVDDPQDRCSVRDRLSA